MSFDSDSMDSMYPVQEADAEYVPQLEKDYCTDFSCCGKAIADLHELVSHFEEHHVTVVSADGVPVPPSALPDSPTDSPSPQTASSSALESPRSSYANTPPPPNLFPTLTSAFQPRESAFASVTTSPSRDPYLGDSYNRGKPSDHLAKEEQYVFDAMLHSEAYDCNAVVGMQAPLDLPHQFTFCAPPSQLFSTANRQPPHFVPHHSTSYPSQPGYSLPYSRPPTLAPTPVYARPPTLSIITDFQAPEQPKAVKKLKGENTSWVSASESEESLPARRRKAPATKQLTREKAYRCPHQGCIKSYLNMNGLKYHLTKGVCDLGPRAT